MATQVQPPMTDKELNKMFLKTLKEPYYDRMIENLNTNFSDVVSAGEMIESGVKLDKIESTEAKKPTFKKKEGETHVMSYQGKVYNPSYSRQPDRGYQSYNQYAGATHKGMTSPTLGQWLVSLLCLHQPTRESLNHWASKEIMPKEQGLSKRGLSSTPFL